ncbi:MAG: hypothetical protein WC957_05325 [Candidatus Neomarinimicrobiota bacterium]
MKRKKRVCIIAVVGVLLLTFSISWANNRLMSSIQQICLAYQVNISGSDMNLVSHPNGTQELIINVQSGRNNFDRIMLIGFYAAGKAIKYHQATIEKVTIIVSMEFKGNSSINATATMADIINYVDGNCSSSDFVRKLKFS